MAVTIDLQRAVKVRAFFYGSLAIVFHFSAPENDLAAIICAFEFQPSVIGIHSSGRKGMSDRARAYNHVHAHSITATD